MSEKKLQRPPIESWLEEVRRRENKQMIYDAPVAMTRKQFDALCEYLLELESQLKKGGGDNAKGSPQV